MELVDYSIVIPAWNEEAELPATLDSVNAAMKLQELRGECIVVDNNSTDSTPEVAKEKGALVVFEPHNQISRARNAGGRHARGRYIIFIDADTRIPVELLSDTLANLESGSIVGGGALLNFDSPVGWFAKFCTSSWTIGSRLFRLAAGSYVYCLKKAFDSVGGFDEKVYAGEEIGFSYRLNRWGKKRKLRFKVLDYAVETSSRKLDSYSSFYMFRTVIFLMLCPWAMRSKRFCGFWYSRAS